jgi:hypothetical protein
MVNQSIKNQDRLSCMVLTLFLLSGIESPEWCKTLNKKSKTGSIFMQMLTEIYKLGTKALKIHN